MNRTVWKKAASRLAAIALGSWVLISIWQAMWPRSVEEGVIKANGRLEVLEFDVSSRTAGRIKSVKVKEGAAVQAGEALVWMDTASLEAQGRQAEARLAQSRSALASAKSQWAQRRSDREAARAVLASRRADLKWAQLQRARSLQLAQSGFVSSQAVDLDEARVESAVAAWNAARAQLAATEAAMVSAEAQSLGALALVAAEEADVARFQADIDDAVLKAPRAGRIQYVLAQDGEVVGAGGKVLSLIDLNEVNMTVFLPMAAVGPLALNSEARLVLDSSPAWVIPAVVSFVAEEAQFTPRTVETASEREKLMFRVRLRVAPEIVQKYRDQIKAGLPGVAYVRLDPVKPWPEHLRLRDINSDRAVKVIK